MDFTDEQLLTLTAQAAGANDMGAWNPLIDDAQCMKLIKRFGLGVSRPENGVITVINWETRFAESKDYNRAVCECVARSQYWKDSQLV